MTEQKPPEEEGAPNLRSVLTSIGYAGRDQEYDTAADQALADRPYFSIRMRLALVFALFFALSLVTTLWAVKILSDVHDKILFLEVADDYELEIQQARRYEKNFLLYKTNLDDARRHARAAKSLSTIHQVRFRSVAGSETLQLMNNFLDDYIHLLDAANESEPGRYEDSLRNLGSMSLGLAQTFVVKERDEIHSMLSTAHRVPIIFLIVLALIMILIVAFLTHQIAGTLSRFLKYTERIATGDLSPITPTRKYRDEFSSLALMINRMVRELERQHRILLESHKLRAMGTLVAGVAHELNNPINNILLTASLFEEEYDSLGHDERREMLQDLVTQSERTKRIVGNLLDFARESETRVEPLDLRIILDETTQLVHNHIKVKKIRLKMDLMDDLPPVHGDRQLLRQVFMNLILNAVDALPEKGEIRITETMEQREGYLGINISDNGPGIPRHILSQIFDPFFTTKPSDKGTGLGLSVSRGIVRKLGGYLVVESQQGVGTTFTVLLPMTTIPSDFSALHAAAGTSQSGDTRATGEGA